MRGMEMALFSIEKLLSQNEYPGRGIIIGKSSTGKSALIAYFIMGRSENSRNRIFEKFEGGMRTKAYDESKLKDPSLIIYNPYLSACGGKADIITNGDQTNTIFDYVEKGSSFEDALMTREFEPDAPNYTPRISGIVCYYYEKNDFRYKLSILKSAN
jgi:IMP cyclohydrolase